jgi:carbamoyl-phosphate synthase small subunit
MQQTTPHLPTGSQKALLVLEDGNVFVGKAFGKIGTASGEICFNTGMTGYQEVFTDPSYTGQVIIMNNVHVGNYGTYSKDVESNTVKIKALIGRNLEDRYSRYFADSSLQQYLDQQGIVAIEAIDTRALVAHVRTKGAMNCIISSEILEEDTLKAMLQEVPSMAGLELASTVSTKTPYELGNENGDVKSAVLDFGTKQHILQCMVERGATLKVFPAKISAEEVRSYNADGYFISNGPGDPASMDYAIYTIKELLKDK